MRDRLGDDASPDRADVIVMGVAPWYSYVSGGINSVVMDDVIAGEDRPKMEMDL